MLTALLAIELSVEVRVGVLVSNPELSPSIIAIPKGTVVWLILSDIAF